MDVEERDRGALHDAGRGVGQRARERRHRGGVAELAQGGRRLPADVGAWILEERANARGSIPALELPQSARRVHAHAPAAVLEERRQHVGRRGVPHFGERASGAHAHHLSTVAREGAQRGNRGPVADPAQGVGHAPAHLGARVAGLSDQRRHQLPAPDPRGREGRVPALVLALCAQRPRHRGSASLRGEIADRGDERLARRGIDLALPPRGEGRDRGGIPQEPDRERSLAPDRGGAIVQRREERLPGRALLDQPQRARGRGPDRDGTRLKRRA